MALDQLMFNDVIVEADECYRVAQDELRSDVQQWFDQLDARKKDQLGAWLDSAMQYDAMVALHAAAGDWNRTRLRELRNLINERSMPCRK